MLPAEEPSNLKKGNNIKPRNLKKAKNIKNNTVMKHIFRLSSVAICLLMSMLLQAKPRIERAEPLSWFTNMKMPLTLMLQGEDLADATVTIQQLINGKPMKGQCLGLTVKRQHNAESPNYLFVDMDVNQSGTYRITLTKEKKWLETGSTPIPQMTRRKEGTNEKRS